MSSAAKVEEPPRMMAPRPLMLRLMLPDRIVRAVLAPSDVLPAPPALPAACDVSAVWAKLDEVLGASAASSSSSLPVHERCRILFLGRAIPTSGVSLASLGIKNGDQLTVEYLNPESKKDNDNLSTTATLPKSETTYDSQDVVDKYIEILEGSVGRKINSQLCLHDSKQMCENCAPLKSFDPKLVSERNIKHLSFHSYLRRCLFKSLVSCSTSGFPSMGPGGSYNGASTVGLKVGVHPLTPTSYRVANPCSAGHRPWPESICSKCQPSAISLQRQEFRLVDHLEFESPKIVEDLVHHWRTTGTQRASYMYGRYEPYDLVPLGVKAVVCALYEPPQRNASDGLMITGLAGHSPTHPADAHAHGDNPLAAIDAAKAAIQAHDRELAKVDDVAAWCGGLVRVGLLITDLTDDGTGKGNVLNSRNEKTYFLTSHEIMLAAYLQKMHPIKSRFSPSGIYGSRFVTCIISGDKDLLIVPEAYQVSESAVAMFDAGIIEPSTHPARMLLKSTEQAKSYVPEVMYFEKNEFGHSVQKSAFPDFPVDFFIVNVSHGSRIAAAPSQGANVAPATGITASLAPAPSEKNTDAAALTTMFTNFAYPAANRTQVMQSPQLIMEFVCAGMLAPHYGNELFFKDFNFLVNLHCSDILTAKDIKNICQFLFLQSESNPVSPSSGQSIMSASDSTNKEPHAGASRLRSMHECESWMTLAHLAEHHLMPNDAGRGAARSSARTGASGGSSSITSSTSMHDGNDTTRNRDNAASFGRFSQVPRDLSVGSSQLDFHRSPASKGGAAAAAAALAGGDTGIGAGSQEMGADFGIGGGFISIEWHCVHCTFINDGDSENCDMCGLPKP